jgi:steroid delta-isomerase-like uncharacterized protein
MAITDTVRKFFQAVNDSDSDAAAALVTDDAEFRDIPGDRRYNGPDGVKANFEFWLGAFPDGKVEIVKIIEAGDTAVVEYKGRGTNTGTLRMETGDIPATGKQVEMEFCDVLEMRGDKIAGGRSYYDTGSLMQQLGLIPVPAAAGTR